MNEIQVFNFNSNSVRVVVREGEPWFVAKDVCRVLELDNPRSTLALLDDDEKGVHSMDTLGGNQSMTVVTESGLYSLILRSRKPEAKMFKKWVTSEVLPSIRKHGAYLSPDKIEEVLSDPDTIIRLATTLKQEKEQRAIAEAERDKVIREKAWISEKREATALGKLGAAVKKINTLEDKLGEGKKWKSVRAIKWLP